MSEEHDAQQSVESVIVLLDELHPFPNHPFKVIRDDALDALAESIRKNGLLNRIIIRPRDEGGYEIIAGHRRTEAMSILGHSTISAELHWDMDDDAAVLAMIETNLRQRPKLLHRQRSPEPSRNRGDEMAGEEKRILEMDHHEHGVVLNALNEYRNDVIAEGRTTDLIDEVLLKAIDAPTRKEKRRRHRGDDR